MKTIEYAIKMELEGQKFYEEQAELNKNNELNAVFFILAESEKAHYELLKKRQDHEPLAYDEFERPDIESLYKDVKSYRKEIRDKQLDVYRLAAFQEEKSIQLYQDLMAKTIVPENKDLYKYLIEQEKEHLNLFEDLVILLLRPEEWVESAEFGIREEY